jgi:hypothetical protein
VGAFIGVLCALGIAVGGYESMLEERARRKRGGPSSRAAKRASVPPG